jgi:hypothetical protein
MISLVGFQRRDELDVTEVNTFCRSVAVVLVSFSSSLV